MSVAATFGLFQAQFADAHDVVKLISADQSLHVMPWYACIEKTVQEHRKSCAICKL